MATKYGKIIEPLEEIPHSFQAMIGCADDKLLRDQKPPYEILHRPKRGPDIWIRDGITYTAAEALQRVHGLKGGL